MHCKPGCRLNAGFPDSGKAKSEFRVWNAHSYVWFSKALCKRAKLQAVKRAKRCTFRVFATTGRECVTSPNDVTGDESDVDGRRTS